MQNLIVISFLGIYNLHISSRVTKALAPCTLSVSEFSFCFTFNSRETNCPGMKRKIQTPASDLQKQIDLTFCLSSPTVLNAQH